MRQKGILSFGYTNFWDWLTGNKTPRYTPIQTHHEGVNGISVSCKYSDAQCVTSEDDRADQEYEYSKYFKTAYKKPHYRITITPVLYWKIQSQWILKHWGARRLEAPYQGGYRHKFFDYGDVLYYRVE
jgi:hypothetical protein